MKKQKNNIGIITAIGATIFAMVLMLFQYFYIGVILKKSFENESREIAFHTAQEVSKSIEVYFRDALTLTRTYSDNILVYRQNKLNRTTIYGLLKGSLKLNTNFLAIWTMFEPNAYDNRDDFYRNSGENDSKGNFAITYYYHGNEIKVEINDTSDYLEDYYTIPKKYRKPVILDPFYYQYHDNDKKYFETSLISPVMDKDNFLGVIGIDIDMYELQARYNGEEVYNDGYVCILSHSGEIVTHKNPLFIEHNISEYTKNENFPVLDSMKSGREFSTESFSLFTNKKAVRYFYPINIEFMAAPWYIMIEMPEDKTMERVSLIKNISLILLLASLLLLSYLVYNITDRRIKEKKLIDYISKLEMTDLELKKYQEHLEDLVRERTNQIEKLNEELVVSNEGLHTVNEHILKQKNELSLTLEHLKNAQDQLVISEKMASLGILASGIAHEINNPLNFIQGGILGLETYFKENLEKHIENVSPLIDAINVGVKRSANIVLSLSHYSRNDDLLHTSCDIHFIIDNCITMLDIQLREKAKIYRNYWETPLTLAGSEGKLHQAFLNILTNACQSISKDGVITISTRKKDNVIVISIDDNGCGISREYLDKVFDPFFTTKGPGKGTGLGLSVTYKIIQEHKGTIEFVSEQSKGTKVIIKLPSNK